MAASPSMLALPPAPSPPRPRTLIVATGLAIAGLTMAFAGLIGTYFALRAEAGGTTSDWVPEGTSLPLVPGNMALITLVMSAVTMQWAVHAIGRDDRRNTYVALGLTIMLGAAFINAIAFFVDQSTVAIRDSVYGVLFHAIVGSHVALTIAGLVFVALMAFRALGGQFSARDREGLAAAAMFWHFTVAVFAAVTVTVIWFK